MTIRLIAAFLLVPGLLPAGADVRGRRDAGLVVAYGSVFALPS